MVLASPNDTNPKLSSSSYTGPLIKENFLIKSVIPMKDLIKVIKKWIKNLKRILTGRKR
jgi:hypothetical protein